MIYPEPGQVLDLPLWMEVLKLAALEQEQEEEKVAWYWQTGRDPPLLHEPLGDMTSQKDVTIYHRPRKELTP